MPPRNLLVSIALGTLATLGRAAGIKPVRELRGAMTSRKFTREALVPEKALGLYQLATRGDFRTPT